MDLSVVRASFIDELTKISTDLTEAARAKIKSKNFALTPSQSSTGAKAYPIHDRAHARAALGMVGMHGTPEQKAEVRKDVAKKYPGMIKEKNSMFAAPAVTAPTMGVGTLPTAHTAPSVAGSAGPGGVGGGQIPKAAEAKGTFWQGAQGEVGPAAGATLGAGIAKMTGHDPLGGAALGYGVGSLPMMVIEHLKKKGKL
jgi:hypothetical protein